jgi:hypothetical protein
VRDVDHNARLLSLTVLLGACAQGGPSGPIDSTPAVDDARVDAHIIDARPAMVDASPFDAPIDAPMIDAMVDTCANPTATCATAIDLGTISGDTGAAQKTASGYQAGWYKIRISENDSDVFGIQLSMTARLTSPASANYDVFVYINTSSDVIECNTPSGSATSTGLVDQKYLIWGESGTFSNGVDDDRTVSIEIRPVSGTCQSNQPWQLVVIGNT